MKKDHIRQKDQRRNQSQVEQESRDGSVKTEQSFWKRTWFRALATVIVLVVVVVVFGLPQGAKYYVTDWLKKNGAEQVLIEKIGWNPFTGKFWLDGVDLVDNGNVLLKQASLWFEIGYGKLFSKDISFSSVVYEGLFLELEQKASGSWKIATVTIPAAEKAKTTVETTVAEGSGEKDAQQQALKKWGVLADNVSLRDCHIHYKTPVFDFQVDIDSAELRKLSSRDGQSGTLELKGSVNGEPISLDLKQVQFSPALRLNGNVEIGKFNLDALDLLLQSVLPVFDGDFSLAGKVDFTLGNGEIDVKYDGDIAVAQADVGSKSFRTRADMLRWQGKVHYRLQENAPMIVDTNGVMQADGYRLDIPSVELDTSEKLIRLTGATTVTIDDGVLVNNRGQLEIGTVDFRLPVLQTTEDSLVWKGEVFFDLARENLVKTDGHLVIANINFSMPELPMEIVEQQLDWQGSVHFSQSATEKRVDAEGELSADSLEITLAEKDLFLTEQKMQLNTKATLFLGEQFALNSTSSLRAGEFALFTENRERQLVGLQRLELKDFKGLGPKELRMEELFAERLAVKVDGGMPVDITVPSLHLAGFDTADLQEFSLSSLALNNSEIIASHNGKNLLALQDISCNFLTATLDGEVSVKSLLANKLAVLDDRKKGGAQPALNLSQIDLEGITWSGEKGLVVQLLDFQNVRATVVREKDGKFELVKRLAAMQKTGPAATAASQTETGKSGEEKTVPSEQQAIPVPIRLDKVQMSGDNRIVFEDYTLKLPYKTSVKLTEFSIEQLNSAKPEQKSPLQLAGILEERAPLKITGSLSPFLDNIGLELSLSLKNYPLSSLSPYTMQSIGAGLASGQLQLDSSVALRNNYLKNDNQILLRKLKTNLVSKQLVDELSKQLPVPLDTALSILRDRDGNINLSVPLTGKVDDLHIGLADVLVVAISKAVVPALTGYAVYALGPYGALAYVGMKLGEDLLKEGSVPVIFIQGETELVEEQKKSLVTIGKRMQDDNKQGDIQVCPIVASWEFMSREQLAKAGASVPVRETERNQLEELGQTRARNIQQYLVQSYGIDEGRLLLCDTVIKEEKKMLPLVILQK